MTSSLELWSTVGGMAVRTGVRQSWLDVLGPAALAALEGFLTPTGGTATAYPCGGGESGCARRVITHDPADIVAVCGSDIGTCERLTITKSDLAVLELDIVKLGAHLGAVFGLTGTVEAVRGCGREGFTLGAFVPFAGKAHRVFLLFPASGAHLEQMTELIFARERERAVLIVPTDRHLSGAVRDLTTRSKAVFATLADLFALGPEGLSLRPGAEDLLSELRGSVRAAGLDARFPTPAGADWADVEIRFENSEQVSIAVRGVVEKRTYGTMGMQSRLSARPTRQWLLLERLADRKGVFPSLDRGEKKQAQNLGARLQAYFGIDSDPFLRDEKRRPQRTRFRIRGY